VVTKAPRKKIRRVASTIRSLVISLWIALQKEKSKDKSKKHKFNSSNSGSRLRRV